MPHIDGIQGNDTSMTRISIVSEQKTQILAIIGQGYVGLPLAMAAVDAGWTVIGIDNFEAKVTQINAGSSPVEDISDTHLMAALKSGSYKATTDFAAITKASVITICVPTPLDEKHEPDLSFLKSAVKAMAPFIANETLVVSESTSYPGTLRDIIIPIVDSVKPKSSTNLFFASAPERVNPGSFDWNQKNTPRLVGAIDSPSQDRALTFYKSICDVVVSVSSPEVAEAAKLLENTFRLVNIALVNEFTQLCASTDIDVQEVIAAASSKPYGFMSFYPGIGVGGHCIPIDPLYLTWWARKHGNEARLVEMASEINHSMPQYIAQSAINLLGTSLKNPKVLILGVAYKSGVGDVRETPASELRDYLQALGATVEWNDPLVPDWLGTQPVGLDWPCDLVILATRQPNQDLRQLLKSGIPILDCTNSITGYPNVSTI
jgi:UDP-N-acetyl-D-glucosamine dehydrogenase